MLDVVIKGGDLIDGTGSPAVGPTSASPTARSSPSAPSTTRPPSTIDATGKVVTPGFVDVHTHFDAQVFWDGALTPSPLHGVTTALAGNCGFTIAPLSTTRPTATTSCACWPGSRACRSSRCVSGVPWNWTSTARVLRRDRRPARHQRRRSWWATRAIRRVVMGEECVGARGDPRRDRHDAGAARATASKPAGSASRRRGRAPTTTPTATWCRRATPPTTRSSRSPQVTAGSSRARHWSSSRRSAERSTTWAVELMADMSLQRAARPQLEHHERRRRQSRRVLRQARGVR